MADGGSWKAEIRKGRSSRRFDRERYPGFAYRRDGKYAHHWERSGLSSSEVGAFKAAARADGFKLVAWEEAYERSTTYRKAFLAANPGPWRCRYCNRRIDRAERMTVDHIVPVAAVKTPSRRAGRSPAGCSVRRAPPPSTTAATSPRRARAATRARGRRWGCGRSGAGSGRADGTGPPSGAPSAPSRPPPSGSSPPAPPRRSRRVSRRRSQTPSQDGCDLI